MVEFGARHGDPTLPQIFLIASDRLIYFIEGLLVDIILLHGSLEVLIALLLLLLSLKFQLADPVPELLNIKLHSSRLI